MKTILIYGDSNTWGQKAYGNRYSFEEQWTNILQQNLGQSYYVVQSGISGRTADSYSNSEKRHKGNDAFEYAYLSSYPFALIIIALGTNDLNSDYHASPESIYKSLLWYEDETKRLQSMDERKFGKPTNTKLLYVLPPNFDEHKSPERSEKMRLELIDMFKNSGLNYVEVHDLDMSEDGIHFASSAHHKLANVVFKKIEEMKV